MKRLRSTLLLLALAAQVPHAAALFHRLAPPLTGPLEWLGVAHALVYALALEGAIYYFVQRGKGRHSWFFAAASIGTNALYYWQEAGMSPLYMASGALISFMLPLAIAFYSHDSVEPEQVAQQQEQPVALPASIEAPQEQALASWLQGAAVVEQPQEQPGVRCPVCNEWCKSSKALNAHSKKHINESKRGLAIGFAPSGD